MSSGGTRTDDAEAEDVVLSSSLPSEGFMFFGDDGGVDRGGPEGMARRRASMGSAEAREAARLARGEEERAV